MAVNDSALPSELPRALPDSDSSSSENSAEVRLRHLAAMTPKLAKLFSEMKVTDPEVLRVTRASAAFEKCGKALRGAVWWCDPPEIGATEIHENDTVPVIFCCDIPWKDGTT